MIEYNQPFEVTQHEFILMYNRLAGIIATREEKGKYFIKLMLPNYKGLVNNFYNSINHENHNI